MQTEALFDQIGEQIQQEINDAEQSLLIAAPWFTNRELFDTLYAKAKNGCSISLIIGNESTNEESSIDFNQLSFPNVRIYKAKNDDNDLMLNHFCVIDHNTTITGSYNLGYNEENDSENVIITRNDTALADQFTQEFNRIVAKYYNKEAHKESNLPINKLLKRLDILKNYIQLEDTEEINKELSKLEQYEFNSDIANIAEAIRQKEYASAVNYIQEFISKNQQLAVWQDPEIDALKFEAKLLENKLNAYDNEKIELEKLLSQFNHRHSLELGDIILEILRLRKSKFKSDSQKYKEAEEDEKEYKEQVNTEKEREVYKLTEGDKKDLKDKFRKATMLCHPDKVNDEFVENARETFVELKKAYENNDIEKVDEILNSLESGQHFKSKSDTFSEKHMLKATIDNLRKQINELEQEITKIKESETYQTIINIDDWDDYFKKTRKNLENELEELKKEVKSENT